MICADEIASLQIPVILSFEGAEATNAKPQGMNQHRKNYVFVRLPCKRAAEVSVMFGGRGKAGATTA